jgi:hypothetical protein
MSCRRSQGGYTAVEVLLAITVLTISSVGVISMQKAAIQGNLDARRLDVANSISRVWLDRLATDATTWNSQSGLAQTLWLNTLVGAGYQTPAMVPAAMPIYSPAFDIMGRDLFNIATDPVAFCVHVNVIDEADAPPIAQVGQMMPPPPGPVLLRATVLVFWPKSLLGGGAPATDWCTSVPDVAAAEAGAPGTYHMIYATEALRRN